METQVALYQTGGGAVHKITGSFVGTVSAYFDAGGRMVDAEQIVGRGLGRVSRYVKPDGPVWNYAQEVGGRSLRDSRARADAARASFAGGAK